MTYSYADEAHAACVNIVDENYQLTPHMRLFLITWLTILK
jgi:hypothetical protein